jgi:hypothetical protein
MTSLLSYTKQIPANGGYYVTLTDIRSRFYYNNGTEAAPQLSTVNFTAGNQGGVSSVIAVAGGMLRDHGVTLLSSGRVFRKVQVMCSTNQVRVGGSDGVGGDVNASYTTPSYGTGFIELPGTGGYSSGSGNYTQVARLG